MARLMFVVLLLAMAAHSSGTSWCICKHGLSESALQKTLDYACGAGADCTLIHQNGGCFNPNTVLAHCSFAVNSFFQRKGQASGSCDFAGAAALTTSDPSISGCVYPSSASSSGTGATPVTTPPNTKTPTPITTPITTPTTTPTTTTTTPMGGVGGSPYVTTPSNGVLGGGVSGLGPSGVGINNNDESHAGLTLQPATSISFLSAILAFSGLVFLSA